MREEKRRSQRHRVRFQLVYDDGSSFHAGAVRDLSEFGLFLETRELLPVGSRVSLSSIDVDDQRAFELSARVVRVVPPDPDRNDAPTGMGLELEEVSDRQRQFLVRLIGDLEAESAQFEGEPDPYFGKSLPRDGLQRSPSGVWKAPDPEEPLPDDSMPRGPANPESTGSS